VSDTFQEETARPRLYEKGDAMPNNNPPNMSDYMTVKEATGGDYPISRTSLYRKIKAKQIKKYKFGGITLVKISDIEMLIKEA